MRRRDSRRLRRARSSALIAKNDGLTVDELSGSQFAYELLVAREVDLTGHAIERRIAIVLQQFKAKPERVDAKRVQAFEVDGVAQLRARIDHHRGMVGLQ